jgi:hypothetical protein
MTELSVVIGAPPAKTAVQPAEFAGLNAAARALQLRV